MMKYLLFASLVFIFNGFTPNGKIQNESSDNCFNSSIPKFTSALYSASVDVVGHHISGLLFLKTMPDSSKRAVFSNEAGITYFDFEWKKNGDFKTYRVTRKLRKRIVLNTLKKDFELVLIPTLSFKSIERKETNHTYSAIRKKETVMFTTNLSCQSIVSIDVMGKKGKLVNTSFFPDGKNIPDSVSIVHYNFNMKIGLKRLAQ